MSQVTLKDIYSAIESLRDDVKDTYVTKDKYDAEKCQTNERLSKLEKLVFGAVALALTTLGKAIIELVTQVQAMR